MSLLALIDDTPQSRRYLDALRLSHGCLNSEVIGDSSSSQNRNNTAANAEALIFAIGFLDVIFIKDFHIAADASILIDNGMANSAISTDA